MFPIPTLLSGLGGSASFRRRNTRERKRRTGARRSVTLEVDSGYGPLLEGIGTNPQETNSRRQGDFAFTCPAGYCSFGETLSVGATDEDGPALGPLSEDVGEIQFAGASYAGQTDTLEIQDLGGAETETNEKHVILTLNGSPVELSDDCTTSASGSLPFAGELGACAFIVPEIRSRKDGHPPCEHPGGRDRRNPGIRVSFPLRPTPLVEISPSSGLERSVIAVKGSGFAGGLVKVGFTPRVPTSEHIHRMPDQRRGNHQHRTDRQARQLRSQSPRRLARRQGRRLGRRVRQRHRPLHRGRSHARRDCDRHHQAAV